MQHDLEKDRSTGERLRALPDEPPPYGWREFQRRAAERTRSGRAHTVGLQANALMMVAAAAAGVVLAIVGVTLWDTARSGGGSQLVQQAHVGRPSASPEQGPTESPAFTDITREAQVAALEERWLASQPHDPALVRVGSRAAVAGLEDRIAQLDDEISAERALRARSARVDAIQQQRALLVRSLALVSYAEDLAAQSR